MKRLIFLIWLLINSPLWANTKTVVIGDSTYFNYTHTTAIDSAQLILIRGTVKDTLSLMPITGSSHKICDWEGIFNQVDSAGNYNVWIEPYSSGAIADTILGDCLVELDSVLVDGSALAATAGAISNTTLVDDLAFDSVHFRIFFIDNNTTTPAFVARNSAGDAANFHSTGGIGAAGLHLSGDGATAVGLLLSGATHDMGGAFYSSNFEAGAIDANALAADAVEEIVHGTWGHAADSAWAGGSFGDSAKGWGATGASQAVIDTVNAILDTLQLYDDRLALEASLTNAIDSINAILDTLQLYDGRLALEASLFDYTNDSVITDVSAAVTAGGLVSKIRATVADTLIDIGVTLGSGDYACTLHVYDTGNTIVVPDIRIRIDNDSNVGAALGYTNASGYQTFRLMAGTYYIYVPSNLGFIQTINPETLVFTGAGTDTIEVTAFDPGSPPTAGTGNLWGYIKTVKGAGLEGAIVTAEIPDVYSPLLYEGAVITPFLRADTTDSDGYWEIPLYQYDEVSDTTFVYNIKQYEPSSGGIIGGEILNVLYQMPDLESHRFTPGGPYDKTED